MSPSNEPKVKSALQDSMEGAIEKIIFGGRWLLAPLYIGLLLSLVPLLYRFFKDFIGLLQLTGLWTDLMIEMRSLISDFAPVI